MKKLALFFCLAAGGFIGSPAFAAVEGSCWPTSGSAKEFTIVKSLTANDIPGKTEKNWDNLGNFDGICYCKDAYKPESILFLFTSSRLSQGSGKRNADFIYYPLDVDNGINIGMNVKIGGAISSFVPVDLQNTSGVDNEFDTTLDCDENNDRFPFATGSEGIVSLELTKPLSGSIHIPAPELITIFARKKSGNFDYAKPFVKLNFDLTVIIPPQCVINGGQAINVPFGDISVNEFKPEAAKKEKDFDIHVSCKNPDDVSKVSIKFRTSDFNGSGFIKTHNDEGVRSDLGIKLKHNGNKIDGSSPAIPTQEGNVTITATPVQQGEKSPEPGKFEATSTLDFEFK
jgi:type 1 fimbria pilin